MIEIHYTCVCGHPYHPGGCLYDLDCLCTKYVPNVPLTKGKPCRSQTSTASSLHRFRGCKTASTRE